VETGSYLTAHTTIQSSGIELRGWSVHLSRGQRAFSSSPSSPRQSLQDKKADLALRLCIEKFRSWLGFQRPVRWLGGGSPVWGPRKR